MNYAEARQIAIDIGNRLLPFCDRLNIAGSVRRKKPDPKDLEIVCLPRLTTVTVPPADMFSEPTEKLIVSPGFAKEVLSLGRVIKGKPDGRYMQIELPQGINLDLFMPQRTDFIRQYVIRTGSAEYSKLVAQAWVKKGWVGTDGGLRLRRDCTERKAGWVCTNPNPILPPVWDTEEEFFAFLDMTYLKPEHRNF